MYWVLDDNNNKIEAFDKQGVLNALNEAIDNGSLAELVADAAFVNMLRCCVSGSTNKVAFVDQQTYNELEANGQLIENCYYFITDDDTTGALEETINNIINGNTIVARATRADIATYASEDTSKGTIEERLTSLGFKEGVLTTGECEGTVVAISENSLKKQGKYVICNFTVDIEVVTDYGDFNFIIPEGFIPKSNVSSHAGSSNWENNITTVYARSNGTLKFSMPYEDYGYNDHRIFIENFGWETE